jgi:hypothetical protein
MLLSAALVLVAGALPAQDPLTAAKAAAQKAAAATNAHTEAEQRPDAQQKPAAKAPAQAPAQAPTQAPASAQQAKATPGTTTKAVASVPANAPANAPASVPAKTAASAPAKAPANAPANAPVTATSKTAATKGAPATTAAAKGTPAKGAGKPATSATVADTAGPPPSILREVFAYGREGRRDPFNSLMSTSELRPTMSDLRLTGVLFDPADRRSSATLRDVTSNVQYRVGVGTTLGRMRVSSIRNKTVLFTIEEFGSTRQDSLVLGDSTKVRRP